MSTTTDPSPHLADRAARLGLAGLLVVGAFVGYEWLMSGLTKIIRGGFASGLADELSEKSDGAAGWYRSFLDGTVIPNGKVFGILIEVGEVAIGAALIATAILLLWRGRRLSYRVQMTALVAIALASLGGILMNVNFHLANGSPHPWLIPGDGFDEGVDLDSLLPLIQLVFLVVATALLISLRRERRSLAQPAASEPSATLTLLTTPDSAETTARRT